MGDFFVIKRIKKECQKILRNAESGVPYKIVGAGVLDSPLFSNEI